MALTLGCRSNFQKNLFLSSVTNAFSRVRASRSSQAVVIEKSLEHPVLVVAEEDDVDIIGPPDPLSNLRPIIRKRLYNETALQQRLRQLQDETQAWNQDFWAKHNTKFITEKQTYIDRFHHRNGAETANQLSAEEMSEFYKKFLDDNWQTHLQYNMQWYKRNFTLLFLALRVSVEKNFAKIR